MFQRRGVRVVEGAGLESVEASKPRFGGSNPPLSASFSRVVMRAHVSMVAPSAPRDARSKTPPGPAGSNGIDRRGCRGQPAGTSPFRAGRRRSAEHTSDLQSLMRNSNAVLLLQKKKTKLN